MIASMAIASLWDSIPAIKIGAHAILDPSFGAILEWNLTFGMLIIVLALTFLMTLIQKYGTNQKELKEIRIEQKKIQEEMKKCRDLPQKVIELNKKQMEFMSRSFKISMGSIVYTAIPFVLFLRWFNDYFTQASLAGFKFFGVLSWFWFYLIFSIVFSTITRKILKTA